MKHWYENDKLKENFSRFLLLTPDSAKQRKCRKKGWRVGFVNLAPYTSSGIRLGSGGKLNLCPYAKTCQKVCLTTAGRNHFDEAKRARRERTLWMHYDRKGFLERLGHELEIMARRAERGRENFALRPNALSDLPWLGKWTAENFPRVQVFDYTKIPKPWERIKGNYHLTFSYDGTNRKEAEECLKRGINVTVVFHEIPEEWEGRRVISGDEDDLRFLDPPGVIVGLRAKGMARRKETGFVVTL